MDKAKTSTTARATTQLDHNLCRSILAGARPAHFNIPNWARAAADRQSSRINDCLRSANRAIDQVGQKPDQIVIVACGALRAGPARHIIQPDTPEQIDRFE